MMTAMMVLNPKKKTRRWKTSCLGKVLLDKAMVKCRRCKKKIWKLRRICVRSKGMNINRCAMKTVKRSWITKNAQMPFPNHSSTLMNTEWEEQRCPLPPKLISLKKNKSEEWSKEA